MSKLIIHETDNHGCGVVHFNGKTEPYAYDMNADVKCAVQVLIEVGFISEDDVEVYEGDELYDALSDLLDIEKAYYDEVINAPDFDSAYEEFEIEGEEEEAE
jgi:hypothetical protein